MKALLLKTEAELLSGREEASDLLIKGIRTSDPLLIEKALSYGADPDTCEPETRMTATMVLAQDDQTRLLEKVLTCFNADPNRANADGFSAYLLAAQKASSSALSLLEKNGADCFARTKQGLSAHMLLSRTLLTDELEGHGWKKYVACRTLLEAAERYGVPIGKEIDFQGRSALWYALDGSLNWKSEAERLTGLGLKNVSDHENVSCMMRAAALNWVSGLFALEDPMGVADRDEKGRTPLVYALRAKARDATRWLMEHHASPFCCFEDGRSVLTDLAERGDVDLMEVLLVGAPVSLAIPDERGELPLFAALRSSKCEMLDLLFQHGAAYDSKNKDGLLPIEALVALVPDRISEEQALSLSKTLSAYRAFDENGVASLAAKKKGLFVLARALEEQALHGAALLNLCARENPEKAEGDAQDLSKDLAEALARGDEAKLQQVLYRGVDPNEAVLQGYLPLAYAIQRLDKKPIVHALLCYPRLKQDVVDPIFGETVLTISVLKGRYTEDILRTGNADPDQITQRGMSLLALACQLLWPKAMEALFAAGCDVNMRFGKKQKTCLMVAAETAGRAAQLVYLEQQGALLDLQDAEGATAVAYAVRSGRLENLQALVDLKADIDRPDFLGRPPLMLASGEMIMILLAAGATINARDKSGKSVFEQAVPSKRLILSNWAHAHGLSLT